MDDKIKEVMGLVNNIISSDNTSYQFDCRNEIESKLRELVPVWLPIETIPRDGSMVLIYDDQFVEPVMRFIATDEAVNDFGAFSNSYWPTHWMPLPAAPKEPTK